MRLLRWPLVLWLLSIVACVIIVDRGRYTADLSAFLPASPTASQRLLVSQLKEGPASRIVLLSIQGGDAAQRALLSTGLARRLRQEPQFHSVANGDVGENPADQEYVFHHRYLLSDRIVPGFFTVDALHARVAETVELLSSPIGLMAKDLFSRDPTGETLEIISRFDRRNPPSTSNGVWASRDGTRALLVVEIVASGSDTDGQQAALAQIRLAFGALAPGAQPPGTSRPALRMSGAAVFAVNARETIRREAVRLSVVSSALIVLFLLFVYRSARTLLVGMLPVASGALAGVAAVTLGFGVVHGITLGFGVTLIGEAVDYSVYLFLQRESGGDPAAESTWTRKFWPTVRLGMLTSIVGFASLLPSSFPGLAQLGCYTIAGLVAAGLVTRFVLPAFPPRSISLTSVDRLGRAFTALIGVLRPGRALLWAIPVAAVAAFSLRGDRLWNRELSALSPVPEEARAFDAALRSDLGAADAGTLVVVSAATADGALGGAEVAGDVLRKLVAAGAIADFESPARYLPSTQAQLARRASLPDADTLRGAFAAAVRDLPIYASRFGGFIEDVTAARRQAPLTLADIGATSMAAPVRALLLEDAGQWTALLPLQAVRAGGRANAIDLVRVRAALAGVSAPGAQVMLLDLKQESDALYGGYLTESLRLSVYGFSAMLVLLLVSLRSLSRVLRVVLPLVLAVLTVMAGFALLGHPLTILNFVGLLLTAAIGSNYALFFDRKSRSGEGPMAIRTVASLVVANLATVIGFGVLATSTVPVLSDVGATVAPGALLALLYSALLTAQPPAAGHVP